MTVYEAQVADTMKPGGVRSHLVIARRDGGLRLASAGTPALDIAQVRDGDGTAVLDGLTFRTYAATGPRWRVVVLDLARARQWAVVEEADSDLLFYLALALPIVLLPVWLAVRSGLAPLRRLSEQVAQRAPDDMRPLPAGRSYRELLPLQQALDRQFARAAQRIARERAFVHDAAHELRTPLAVITAQAHVLADSGPDDRASARQRLEAAVARASHLTQQLLRLARADAAAEATASGAAGAGADPPPVDLMDLLRDVLATLAEPAQALGVELSLDGPDQAPAAIDAQLLRSIAINLVDNALRYGQAGGEVAVALQAVAGQWQLQVADRGPGLAGEQLTLAFERFWRGAPEAAPGSGLGLAIVREAARSLGGSAWLQPREGGGCVATVAWPQQRPGAGPQAAHLQPTPSWR
jgi:signal transduction histidine kinase